MTRHQYLKTNNKIRAQYQKKKKNKHIDMDICIYIWPEDRSLVGKEGDETVTIRSSFWGKTSSLAESDVFNSIKVLVVSSISKWLRKWNPNFDLNLWRKILCETACCVWERERGGKTKEWWIFEFLQWEGRYAEKLERYFTF